MKIIVVYDSKFGNTGEVAKAIAGAIGAPHTVTIKKVGEAAAAEIGNYDFLFIGSPTQGGRATAATISLVDSIAVETLKKLRIAAFDTRLKSALVKIFGYAAGRIQKSLEGRGLKLVAPGEGFFVEKTKGPVAAGELDRAAAWAKKVTEGK